MGTAIADLSNLCPPSEDGAIGRALEELESKLAAWSDAMSSAQASICRFAADCATTPTSPASLEITEPIETSTTESAASVAVLDPTDADSADVDSSTHKPEDNSASEFTIDEDDTAPFAPKASDEDSSTESYRRGALIDRLTDALNQSDHLEQNDAANAAENTNELEPTEAPHSADEDVETILASVDAQVAELLRARHAAAAGEKTMREVCDEYFMETADAERMLATLEPEMAKAIRVQYRLFNGRKSVHQLVREYEPPKEQSKKKSWWRG